MSKLISEPAAYVRSLGQANSETEAMAVLASAYVRSLDQPKSEKKAPAVHASAYVRSPGQPNGETEAPVILAWACSRRSPSETFNLCGVQARERVAALAMRIASILSKAPLEKGGWGVETLNPKRLHCGRSGVGIQVRSARGQGVIPDTYSVGDHTQRALSPQAGPKP